MFLTVDLVVRDPLLSRDIKKVSDGLEDVGSKVFGYVVCYVHNVGQSVGKLVARESGVKILWGIAEYATVPENNTRM